MEALLMGDAEDDSCSDGGVDQLATLLDRSRERLLAQHMLAAADRVGRYGSVRLRRRCDDDRVETLLREQRLRGRKRLHRETLVRRREARPARIANPDETEPVAAAQCREMCGERGGTDADHANTDQGLGTPCSMIRINSKRMPPGERRKTTSRTPNPASTRAGGVTSVAPAASARRLVASMSSTSNTT